MLKKFIQSHPLKFAFGAPIIFLVLVNLATLNHGAFFSLSAEKKNFPVVGEEIPVVLELSAKTPVNAVGGTITFPPDILNVVSISRVTSVVDLWAEEPVVSNTNGTLHFSGGLLGAKAKEPVQGTVFIINFSVLKEGAASIALKERQILASDGKGTNVISESKTLTIYARKPEQGSPDINGDGTLSSADVNTLYFGTFRAYNSQYDLNGDRKVNWGDVMYLIGLL